MTYNYSGINSVKYVQPLARAPLQRHHAQPIGNEQVLFCNTANHLITRYGFNCSTAQKLISLAYSDLKIPHERQRLDLSASGDTLTIITAPDRSMTWAVPVAGIAGNGSGTLRHYQLRLA